MNSALLFVGCIGLLMGVVGCADHFVLYGSGTKASETRQLAAFDQIEIRGAADVDVTVGQQPQLVTVEADDNVLPILETSVRGSTLVISSRENYRPRTPVHVTVVIPSLVGASVSGSGSVRATGVKSSSFAIDISGSGDVKAEGTSDSIKVDVAGSGSVDATRLTATSADVTISGSGGVALRANGSLNASIAGSGDVRYAGTPQVHTHISGSGSVRPM
jgi:hypothetical protein